jgi:hypothetical protein
MHEALRSRLKSDATVSGLVGARVDWGLRPQGKALPAIRLTLVPTQRAYHMGGAQTTQQYQVQADCFGETYKQAFDVRQAVIACLEPAVGEFQFSFVTRDFDRPEVIDTGPVECAVLEFLVTHIPA